VQERDGYAAVRIVLPSLRRRIAAKLGSPFYMGVPNRGFLVCWSRDFGKADDFREQVANDFEGRPHPLSPVVFLVDEHGIRPTEPPAETIKEVRGAHIVEYGVYEDVAELGTRGAEKSTAGHVTAVLDMKLVASTDRVPRKLQTNFGMRFVLEGEPAGGVEEVTIRVLHPPFRRPGFSGDTRSDEWEAQGIIADKRYTGWEFEYPYELVPGRWTIQIVHKDRVLAEKAFTVE
jgi:hypothetical protein